MTSKSKLSSKYQITIPREVRDHLLLEKGDEVFFAIINGQVIVRKATAMDVDYYTSLESTLTEWIGKNDEEAYRDL
jgi:AbrB family looped-hinge helix DNA binding protein